MKISLTVFLLSTALAASAFAGSLGGPAPFRNSSPLATGTDGTYNASFRGTNLSGIFRFSIQEGGQIGGVVLPSISGPRPDPGTANPVVVTTATYTSRYNVWVAWYEGIAYRGLTDAAIMDGAVSGVLAVQAPPTTDLFQPGMLQPQAFQNYLPRTISGIFDGATTNQQIFSIFPPQTFGSPLAINSVLQSGEFRGKLDTKSPVGEMKGTGRFAVVRDSGLDPTRPAGAQSSTAANVYATDITRAANNPRYQAEYVDFRWKGARVQSGNPNLTFARF